MAGQIIAILSVRRTLRATRNVRFWRKADIRIRQPADVPSESGRPPKTRLTRAMRLYPLHPNHGPFRTKRYPSCQKKFHLSQYCQLDSVGAGWREAEKRLRPALKTVV